MAVNAPIRGIRRRVLVDRIFYSRLARADDKSRIASDSHNLMEIEYMQVLNSQEIHSVSGAGHVGIITLPIAIPQPHPLPSPPFQGGPITIPTED